MSVTTDRVDVPNFGQVTFTAAEVSEVEQLVDGSGVVGWAEPLLPTGGRPREELTLRTLLVGLALVCGSREGLFLDEVAPVLNALPPSVRHRLGLRHRQVTTRQVEVLFGHFAKLLDGSPHFAGAELDDAERAERDTRLQRFADAAVDASNGEPGQPLARHFAFDATIITANARPEWTVRRRHIRDAVARARAAGRHVDLESLLNDDAQLATLLGLPAWGQDADADAEALKQLKARTRRASDPDAATIVHKGQLKHAYAFHFATEVPSREQVAERLAYDAAEAAARAAATAAGLRPHQASVPVPKPLPVPCVVRRMTVTASTAEPGPVAVEVMNRLATDYADREPGWRPGDLVEDMGYSQARPDSHHLPLRRAGWELFFDLKRDDRRVTGELDGAVTFAGATFCASVTASVELPTDDTGAPHLPRLPFTASKEARAVRHELVAALEPFRTRTNGRPDADGYVRRGCPAVARFSSPACVGCALRGNLDAVSATVPQVFDPPEPTHKPKLCRQTWITLGPAEVGRDQLFLVDSREWFDAFTRRRPRVEGSNGIVKNPALGHVEKCRFRVRGRAKVSIFAVLLVAMSNLRQWKVWRAKCAKVTAANAELAAAPRRRARRRTGRYDQVIAAPATAAAPPAASPPPGADPPPDDGGTDPPF